MLNERENRLKATIDYYDKHFNEIKARCKKKSDLSFAIMEDTLINNKTVEMPINCYHHLNIKKLNNNITTLLSFLYDFTQEEQQEFLLILSHTELAKIYYDKYSAEWRDMKLKKMHKAKKNLFEKVIEVVKIDKNLDEDQASQDEVIQYLQYLSMTLYNNHFTERNLYEDFLYQMTSFLKTKSYTDKYSNLRPYSQDKIIQIVNELIQNYFDKREEDDIQFSNKSNIENFICKHYIYENMAGIHLTHSN